MGKLIYTMGLVLTKVVEEEQDNAIVKQISDVLEDVGKRMGNCEFMHFQLASQTLISIIKNLNS